MNKYKPIEELNTTICGKLLYLILLNVIDEDNQIVIPQKRIGKALGISKTTVSRNLQKLCSRGYINIIPTYNIYGGRMPNKYIVREG
jgi:DNA-binding MarR family transcriptional regulator